MRTVLKTRKNQHQWKCVALLVMVSLSNSICLAGQLHDAATKGKIDEVVDLTKQSGIDIDQKDADGWTPLHRAIHAGKFSTAEALVKAGAAVNLKGGSKEETPLMLAVDLGSVEFHGNPLTGSLEQVREPNEDFEGPKKPISGQFEFVAYLLKNGADPNLANNTGHSPLHYVAYDGYVKLAALLVKNGANCNALALPNVAGVTPLMFAVVRGNERMVQLLSQEGSDLAVKSSKDGLTALDYAKKEGNANIIKILQDAQAAKSPDSIAIKKVNVTEKNPPMPTKQQVSDIRIPRASQGMQEHVPEDVVVTVEGEKITHGEIMKEVQKSKRAPPQQLPQEQIYNNVTDTIVANILLTKAAEKSGLAVSDDELAKVIATLEAVQPKGTSLKDALAEKGIDYDKWKTDLRKQLLVRKLVEEKTADVATAKEKQDVLLAFIEELKKKAEIKY